MEFPNENSGIVHVYSAEPELRLAHELRRWSHAFNQVKTENNGDVKYLIPTCLQYYSSTSRIMSRSFTPCSCYSAMSSGAAEMA